MGYYFYDMNDQIEDVSIRWANKSDFPEILSLIQVLALFENEPDQVVITQDQLERDWESNKFICMLAVSVNKDVIFGMALCHERYSTWKGLTAHLEDLIVRKDFRGKGIGRRLMESTIQWARSINAKRLHWEVLNWNTDAIGFYESIGSEVLRDWYPCRLSELDMKNFPFEYPQFIYRI
jgi:GNAT superfamily N-acetyltransferase